MKNHTETFAVYVGIFTLTPFETFVGTQGHGLVPFGANLSLTWSSEVGFIYVDGMHRTQKVGENVYRFIERMFLGLYTLMGCTVHRR